MIGKGSVFYAVVREDRGTGYPEILAFGEQSAFVAGKMEDYASTTSGKLRRLLRVKLTVEEILEERTELPVKA